MFQQSPPRPPSGSGRLELEGRVEFTHVAPEAIPLPSSRQPSIAHSAASDSDISLDDLEPLGLPLRLDEPLGEDNRVLDLVPFLTTRSRRAVDSVPLLAARRELALQLASGVFS